MGQRGASDRRRAGQSGANDGGGGAGGWERRGLGSGCWGWRVAGGEGGGAAAGVGVDGGDRGGAGGRRWGGRCFGTSERLVAHDAAYLGVGGDAGAGGREARAVGAGGVGVGPGSGDLLARLVLDLDAVLDLLVARLVVAGAVALVSATATVGLIWFLPSAGVDGGAGGGGGVRCGALGYGVSGRAAERVGRRGAGGVLRQLTTESLLTAADLVAYGAEERGAGAVGGAGPAVAGRGAAVCLEFGAGLGAAGGLHRRGLRCRAARGRGEGGCRGAGRAGVRGGRADPAGAGGRPRRGARRRRSCRPGPGCAGSGDRADRGAGPGRRAGRAGSGAARAPKIVVQGIAGPVMPVGRCHSTASTSS